MRSGNNVVSAVNRLTESKWMPFVRRAARAHMLDVDDVLNTDVHRPDVVALRRRIWATIRWTDGRSYPSVGSLWGGADHTSVLQGVRWYEQYLAAEYARPRPIVSVASSTVDKRCAA